MKKISLLFLLISFSTTTFISNSYGFSIHKPVLNSDQISSLKNLTVIQFLNLSARQYGELTGKKLNLLDRFSFNLIKVKMKHELKKNPGLTVNEYLSNKPRHRLGAVWWVLIGAAGLLLILLLLYAIAGGNGLG